MTRRHPVTLIALASLTVTLALPFGASSGQAQEAEVKAAVSAYQAAFGSLDLPQQEAVFAHDKDTMLILPENKAVAVGWDNVRKSLAGDDNALSELKIMPLDGPHIRVKGDTAWSIEKVIATGKTKHGETFNDPTFDTAIFEKRQGRWLLVSLTVLRVPQGH